MSPKLERIIENLVVNAAKHTPVGTTIWVRLDAQDDGAWGAEIRALPVSWRFGAA